MNRISIALLACGLTQILLASVLAAQDVRSKRLEVRATIENGVATTRITQTIHNHAAGNAEATWVLPLPEGAVADGFTMKVGETVLQGDVLDANSARIVYEAIVRKQRDPGLLEYFGSGCLRARVFPIPSKQDMQVEVTYRQVLPAINGIHRWHFPLDATGIPGAPPEQITLDVIINSQKPICNVFSPTPGVDIVQRNDHRARISLETKSPPRGGLEIFFGLSEKDFGLNLMTFRKAGEKGYFMLMISPQQEWDEVRVMPKSVTFVLDTSGSMTGEKIEQARKALIFFVHSLRPIDTFNIVTFATEAEPFFESSLPASPKNLARALVKCESIVASGGTNIADALARGITQDRDDGRVPLTVFLTDGKPTVGEQKIEKLLQSSAAANIAKSRIFVFGVGDDVNTHLLDRLAADSGGTRNYVRQGEDIEQKTGDLFTKLSHPVMTNLDLHLDGIEATRIVPAKMPHLFRGSRLVVVGRYSGTGAHSIRLSGKVGGVNREYQYAANFAEIALRNDFVPSLWAHRRTGVLLDAIRLNGHNAELITEIKRLGKRFNIVTPYTSHLILEQGLGGDIIGKPRLRRRIPIRYGGPGDRVPSNPGAGGAMTPGPTGPSALGPASPGSARGPTTGGGGIVGPVPATTLPGLVERLRLAGVLPKNAPYAELEQLALKISRELRTSQGGLDKLGRAKSGKRAVDDSTYLAQFSGQTTSSQGFFMGVGARTGSKLASLFVHNIKQHSFVLRRGLWTDSRFDAKLAVKEAWPRVEVVAYSKAYFELLRDNPALRPYLAFSDRMLVVLDKKICVVKPASGDSSSDAKKGRGVRK